MGLIAMEELLSCHCELFFFFARSPRLTPGPRAIRSIRPFSAARGQAEQPDTPAAALLSAAPDFVGPFAGDEHPPH